MGYAETTVISYFHYTHLQWGKQHRDAYVAQLEKAATPGGARGEARKTILVVQPRTD